MTKNIIVTAVVALVVSILVGLFFIGQSSQSRTYGGLSERDIQAVSLSVGNEGTVRGTKLNGIIGTTCNLRGTDSSQAASSTLAYDCAVSGLTSSWKVFAQLATSTKMSVQQSGWYITASKASTTAGYATVLLYNRGPATTPSITGVGSSTVIWAFK